MAKVVDLARRSMQHHVTIICNDAKPLSLAFEECHRAVYNLCVLFAGAHVARIRILAANLLAWRFPYACAHTTTKIRLLDDIAMMYRQTYAHINRSPTLEQLYEVAAERRREWAANVRSRVLPLLVQKWKERFYAPSGDFVRRKRKSWQERAAAASKRQRRSM
jgi:hypothetical protein